MRVTSVAPLLIMRVKNEDVWFLVLGINTYFDDVFDKTGYETGAIKVKQITYTTHYGEIHLDGLPDLEIFVDGVWTSELDFV